MKGRGLGVKSYATWKQPFELRFLHIRCINRKVDNSQENSNLTIPWGWRKRAAAFFPRLCFHFCPAICRSTSIFPLLLLQRRGCAEFGSKLRLR